MLSMKRLLETEFILIALLTSVANAQYHKYDIWEENYAVAGLLGAVQYDDLKFDAPNSAGQETVDASLIPQIGGVWSTLPIGNRFQYGLECSFLLGFKIDKINYLYAGSGGVYVSLSTSMWMFDLAGGAYASLFLDKKHRVRIYMGGGPLMVYADYRTEEDYSNANPTISNSESALGLGVYARTGFEFRVREKGMLGLGARGIWSSVDFSNVGGSSDLAGIALLVSYTAGF